MITSKQRADLRAQTNNLETTLIVGKSGITENLIQEAVNQLENHELVKGKVLETALISAREVSDILCNEIECEAIQCVGSKFVIYKKSEKLAQQRALALKKEARKKINPVRKGAQERRRHAKEEREKRNEYFRQAAIQAAIDRRTGKK